MLIAFEAALALKFESKKYKNSGKTGFQNPGFTAELKWCVPIPKFSGFNKSSNIEKLSFNACGVLRHVN